MPGRVAWKKDIYTKAHIFKRGLWFCKPPFLGAQLQSEEAWISIAVRLLTWEQREYKMLSRQKDSNSLSLRTGVTEYTKWKATENQVSRLIFKSAAHVTAPTRKHSKSEAHVWKFGPNCSNFNAVSLPIVFLAPCFTGILICTVVYRAQNS